MGIYYIGENEEEEEEIYNFNFDNYINELI